MDQKQIITRAEGKAICNIRETKEEMNSVIDHLIMVATSQIEQATGRSFTAQPFMDHFSTKSTIDLAYDDRGWSPSATYNRVRESSYYLSGLNVDPLTLDVRYSTLREWNIDTIVSGNDYYFDKDRSKLTLMIGTRQSPRALRVTYEAGWTPAEDENVTLEDGTHPLTLSGSIPHIIKEACLLQTAYLYSRRRTDNIGLKGDRSHGKADQYVQTLEWASQLGITMEALGLIRGLKMPVVGRY